MRIKILLGIIGWGLLCLIAILEFIEMYNYKRIKVEILGLSLIALGLIIASIKNHTFTIVIGKVNDIGNLDSTRIGSRSESKLLQPNGIAEVNLKE